MCPLKNFDQNYLKFFGLKKTTTVGNYGGGGPMDANPLFSPTDDILRKITQTE